MNPAAATDATEFPAEAELGPAIHLLAAPAALSLAVVALALVTNTVSGVGAADAVSAGLVTVWAAAGLVIGLRQRSDRLAPIALGIAGLGGLAMLCAVIGRNQETKAAADALHSISWVLAGLLCGVFLHLLLGLPHGRLTTAGRQMSAALGYIVGAAVGYLLSGWSEGSPEWIWAALVALFLAGGLAVANQRYRSAGSNDRRRMQWIGWAIAVCAEFIVVIFALEIIADWPSRPWVWASAITALIPLSLIAGTDRRLLARVDHLLAHTVASAGLTALVLAAYVIVVIGLGRAPNGTERSLLLASMVAAATAALLYLPARERLTDFANRLVYGERTAPDEALRTWGSRLTRAIPLDELLLQLAESLRKTMGLASAEIWTGTEGHLELTSSVPHREPPPLLVGDKERAVVARAGVSGGTWIDVWLPELAAQRDPTVVRVGPIAHGGDLLGLIVLERRPEGDAFTEEDDRVVVELARQVGLALHNVQLDSALQQSLDELQRTNEDLRVSRLRIVSAGDSERRRLERDLHDGAQQHLVAMAVKLRLAEDLAEDDPAEAASLIGELRADLKDAIAELRALAHGIFPPLLLSGGLPEALPAAASQAALPTTVDTVGVTRYSPEIESAVYFCCLEALQNAGKHAGSGAGIVVTVTGDEEHLRFEVRDDGAGFEVESSGVRGHGFVNMVDRLGAIGGRLSVISVLGSGTTITGEIPLNE